ncbi:hypothetical protein [Microbacterium sp.]|uniref:hypothetical protein n=1 Tax=Microbacterium sp. TaxID=51671 RepID=UPI002D77B9BA|nr:hypothetical protein [Microbacterium sp.]HET6301831.1 hypothetical protein [Microbacterium sp.]
MLFALYAVLFLGGMYLFGLSFNLEAFQGLVFVAGILLVSAALATPITASAIQNQSGVSRRRRPR